MQLTVRLTQQEMANLVHLGTSDRRSPEDVAEILLRSAIVNCKTLEDFRKRVDGLPTYQGEQAVQSGQKLGIIDTIVEILREAKSKGEPLTTNELHSEVVRRCGSGSRLTITAQLSRLPRERGFKIATHRIGKEVRFAAQ